MNCCWAGVRYGEALPVMLSTVLFVPRGFAREEPLIYEEAQGDEPEAEMADASDMSDDDDLGGENAAAATARAAAAALTTKVATLPQCTAGRRHRLPERAALSSDTLVCASPAGHQRRGQVQHGGL